MSKKCDCNLSDLLILILIVLQFKPNCGCNQIAPAQDCCCPAPVSSQCAPAIDNSILFLVAFYYLTCCKK